MRSIVLAASLAACGSALEARPELRDATAIAEPPAAEDAAHAPEASRARQPERTDVASAPDANAPAPADAAPIRDVAARDTAVPDGAPPPLPEAVRPIDVPFIAQNPELPRGCEVTSLAMLLRHAGVAADKLALAAAIKKVPFLEGALHGNPYDGFVGDMYDLRKPGYGVYHGPVRDLATRQLPGRIEDLTGAKFDDLLARVAAGRPVWIVTNARWTRLPDSEFETWQTSSGALRITYHEHSVVITGYDARTVTINDPLDPAAGKNKRLARADFVAAWEQMGKQAIVVR